MRRLFLPRRLVVSLFCFSCVFHMAPIWPFFFGRDDFGEKVFFFVQQQLRERKREKKKERRADAAREAQTLHRIGLVLYEERSCVILSPCFCDVTKRPPRPVFSSSCCQRERERERVCVCVCVCVCARASERKREKKRARVRNDPSRKKKKKKEYGKRIGYPLRKRREILYRF